MSGLSMIRYIKFVLNHPLQVLIALALLTIILGMGIPKLRFDNSIDVMMPQEDKEYLYYDKVKKTYGNVGKFVIVNVSAKNIWDSS